MTHSGTLAHWTPRWKDHPDERLPRWKTTPMKRPPRWKTIPMKRPSRWKDHPDERPPRWNDHPDERPPRWKTTSMKDHRSFSTTFSRNPFPAHLHLFKLLTKDHPSLSDHFGWLVRVVWHEGFHSSGTNGNISGHGSGNGSCSGAGSSCRSTK